MAVRAGKRSGRAGGRVLTRAENAVLGGVGVGRPVSSVGVNTEISTDVTPASMQRAARYPNPASTFGKLPAETQLLNERMYKEKQDRLKNWTPTEGDESGPTDIPQRRLTEIAGQVGAEQSFATYPRGHYDMAARASRRAEATTAFQTEPHARRESNRILTAIMRGKGDLVGGRPMAGQRSAAGLDEEKYARMLSSRESGTSSDSAWAKVLEENDPSNSREKDLVAQKVRLEPQEGEKLGRLVKPSSTAPKWWETDPTGKTPGIGNPMSSQQNRWSRGVFTDTELQNHPVMNHLEKLPEYHEAKANGTPLLMMGGATIHFDSAAAHADDERKRQHLIATQQQ